MDTISLESFKKLHDISGWGYQSDLRSYTPTYFLDYILKRLPPTITTGRHTPYALDRYLGLRNVGGMWLVDYWRVDKEDDNPWLGVKDTLPEVAAAILAIQLFGRGYLKKEEFNA